MNLTTYRNLAHLDYEPFVGLLKSTLTGNSKKSFLYILFQNAFVLHVCRYPKSFRIPYDEWKSPVVITTKVLSKHSDDEKISAIMYCNLQQILHLAIFILKKITKNK